MWAGNLLKYASRRDFLMFDPPLQTTGGKEQTPQELNISFMLYFNVSDRVCRPERNEYGLTPMAACFLLLLWIRRPPCRWLISADLLHSARIESMKQSPTVLEFVDNS